MNDRELQPEASLNFTGEARGARGLARREQSALAKDWRGSQYAGYEAGKHPVTATVPRPAWMDNPSLLPKRPPGRPA